MNTCYNTKLTSELAFMAHTHVVHLNFSSDFNDASFNNQLQNIDIHIRTICERLAQSKIQTDQWIITWHEYGLTNGPDRYITSEQKRKLKSLMQKLTEKYQKLMIVSGTVATKRLITNKQENSEHKVNQITQSYLLNDYAGSFVLFLFEQMKSVLSLEEFILVRNTAYVFSKGECIKRHDKLIPIDETSGLDNAIIRLGIGRNQENQINSNLILQICAEHSEGRLINSSQTTPLIQMIVSNTISCSPQKCISPYVIHIDKYYPTRLITDTLEENLEVIVSSYSMSEGRLTSIAPTTFYQYAFENLRERIINNKIKFHKFESEKEYILQLNIKELKGLVLNNQNQHIFSSNDYKSFLKLVFDIHDITAARQFAKGLLILFTENECKSSMHNNFQHYLKTLLAMNDAQFISELYSKKTEELDSNCKNKSIFTHFAKRSRETDTPKNDHSIPTFRRKIT